MIRIIESGKRVCQAFIAISALLTVLLPGLAQAALEDEIRSRIAPVGEVCVLGEECAAGMQSASTASSGPKDPMMVYQTYCFACHTTGANNAPVLGDAEMWAPRIEKGIETLYENAINGFNNNAMPARGLCMDCSDDDIRATVDYIVGEVE